MGHATLAESLMPYRTAHTVEDFFPLYDHVLVKPLPYQEMTKSGIHYPGSAKRETSRIGLVIKCGLGDKNTVLGGRHEMNVKPGDKVCYGPRPWAEIRLGGEDYIILHEEQHIYSVIEES